MASGENFELVYQTCTANNPHRSIRKLVQLLEHPITQTKIERQLEYLDEFLCATPYAFWLTDLPFVSRLLEILLERKTGYNVFESYFSRILLICSIPPLQESSMEPFWYGVHLTEFFNVLGYFLLVLEEEYQNLIIYVITALIIRKSIELKQCISEENCRNAIGKSNIPETLANLLHTANDELYKKVVNLALNLAEESETVCQIMIRNSINPLMLRLYPNWRNCEEDDRFEIEVPPSCIENFLEVSKLLILMLDSVKDCFQVYKEIIEIPSLAAFKNFLWVFRVFTCSKLHQMERNTTVVVLLKLISFYPDLTQYTVSGLIDDFALLSVATEMGTAGTWASSVKFFTNEKDFDFKRMILLSLTILKNNSVRKIIGTRNVIPGILRIITPELTIAWQQDYFFCLARLSFRVLRLYVKEFSESFFLNNGPLRTVILIEYYKVRPYDDQILISALQFIKYLSESSIPDIAEELNEYYLIDILKKIWIYFMDFPLTNSSQICLAYIFFIYINMKSLKIMSSFTRLYLRLMKRCLEPEKDDVNINEDMLVVCLKSLWENYEYDENCDLFMKKGGIFALIDIINKYSMKVKVVALGFLTDLCEEGSCIPYVVTWRSKGKTFLNLLMDIFREENKQLKVKLDSNNVIEDLDWPICGALQKQETIKADKSPKSSPSIMDLLGSCRPKIHAILHILKFLHSEKVNLCNEHYHIFNKKITVDDQLVLLLAENYFLLKLAETWSEVQIDLKNEKIDLTHLDNILTDTISKSYKNWAVEIKRSQEEILKQKNHKDLIEEKELYALLKESRLSDSLEALRELRLLSRSSELLFRLRSIHRQRKNLDLGNLPVGNWMFNLQVHPIYNQHVKILVDETKIKEVCDLKEVSEANSEENECDVEEFEQELNNLQ